MNGDSRRQLQFGNVGLTTIKFASCLMSQWDGQSATSLHLRRCRQCEIVDRIQISATGQNAPPRFVSGWWKWWCRVGNVCVINVTFNFVAWLAGLRARWVRLKRVLNGKLAKRSSSKAVIGAKENLIMSAEHCASSCEFCGEIQKKWQQPTARNWKSKTYILFTFQANFRDPTF